MRTIERLTGVLGSLAVADDGAVDRPIAVGAAGPARVPRAVRSRDAGVPRAVRPRRRRPTGPARELPARTPRKSPD